MLPIFHTIHTYIIVSPSTPLVEGPGQGALAGTPDQRNDSSWPIEQCDDKNGIIWPASVAPAGAVKPSDYLKDLLTRLPAARITQVKAFTPAAWAKDSAKPKPVARAA